VVEITRSVPVDAPASAATQEAEGESLGNEGTFAGEHDAPADIQRSVGDQVTGSDTSRSDTARSLGDKSTSGDAVSSLSDLDGSIGELDDSIPLVDLSERYEIQGVLGQGGMGEVLRAFDKRLQRPVAIKRVLSKMAHSRKVLARFLTEAQSIAALNHFNIVQIYDYGRDEQGPFIIMELVEGQSLLEKLKSGPLELEEAIELACQLCDGLAVAHERGIIHRDIKPANILLTTRGEPKLTDFGLARQDSVDHDQTHAGVILGTIDFMPPEQRQDATAADARSDLWSLAATLYQVLTGKNPKVIRLDQVAQSLRPVLGQALEDNPAERYQTARELHAALRLVLTQPSATVASTSDDPFTEGRCPNCATVNDPSRKFCDSCGQPMQEACLSCGHPNSPWNRICGECGSNLKELITAKQEEIDGQKAAVESLRREYRYDEALRQLQELKELDHPRFAGDKSWVENNASSLEAEYDQQKENILVTTEEAIQETNKGKFTEAIKLLEGVPAPLRDEKVLRLLEQSQSNQQEKERLLEEIKQQVATDNLAGLLKKTTRFLELSPGHAQIEKLHSQLQRRHEAAAVKAMGILARAEQLFDQYQDEAVLETLGQCPEEFRQESGYQIFHTHATNRLARIRELDAAIASEASPDRQLRLVESYLELRPGHSSMQQLASALQEQLQTQMLKKENRSQNKRVLTGLACLFSVLLLIFAGFFWHTAPARRDASSKAATDRIFAESVAAETAREEERLAAERDAAEQDAASKLSTKREAQRLADEKAVADYNAQKLYASPEAVAKREADKLAAEKHANETASTLLGHSWSVNSVAFSPDGKRIVSGSGDKTVKIWDATTGQEMLTLKGHSSVVISVSFSPDGKRRSEERREGKE
jgi:predicted amidophosphoribosyltransferase